MIYRKKRIPTVNLERHILHYLVSNKTILQGRISSCRDEWFTSESRFSIYLMISKHFEENHTLLTETQFDCELELLCPGEDNEARRKDIEAEYKIVKEIKPEDEASVIISRLNDALLTCETEDLLMSAYDSLEKGDTEEALSKLKQGSLNLRKPDDKSRVVSLWQETQDWIAEVINRRDYPEKYAGIPTGFRKFDECTGGLFPAELTVIFGLSGKGKSTLMKQVGVNVRRKGFNVLHCGNEENEFQMRTKYISVETGVKYSHWKRGTFTEVEMRKFEEYRDQQQDENIGQLYIYNFPQQTDATMIERQLVELKAKGVQIDLVIVDYLDLMSSIKRAYNENDEGGRVTGDLKQIAINFNIPVLVCTQAGEQAEKQETRERPFLTASDVFGTKRKVHSANTLVGIVNQTATVGAGERDESELKRHRLVICVPKNRDGPVFTFRLIIEVETGRVIEDDENDPIGVDQEAQAEAILQEGLSLEDNSQQTQKTIKKVLENKAMRILEEIDGEESFLTPTQMEEVNHPAPEPVFDDTEEIKALKEQEKIAGSISSLLRSRKKKK